MTAQTAPAQAKTPSAARRRGILDVTLRLLVERGFEGLRVRDIAEAAGINQATLLYHFPDKEELIVAVIGDIIEKVRATNLRDIDVRKGSFQAYETYLRRIGDLYATMPEVYIALNEIAVRAVRHPKIAATFASHMEHSRDFIKTLLRAAAPEATPQAVDAAVSATQVFAAGLRMTAASNGSLAALLKRGKGRTEAARRIHDEIETFCSLIRSQLKARG